MSDSPDEVVTTVNFVADAGKQMLESSSSVSEVLARLRRFVPSVGLGECEIDATLSALTLSYWAPGQPMPITTMRVVEVSDPRLGRLAGADALLDKVEQGQIGVADAYLQLRALERSPGIRRIHARIAILVSVIGWMLFLNGVGFATIAVALLATLLTFPTDALVDRLQLPLVASTFLSAVILAAVPNLIAAAGVDVRVGAAVVGGLFIYLPGRALVSSVIDGLANAPLSAVARGIQAIIGHCCVDGSQFVGHRRRMKHRRVQRPAITVPSAFAGFRFPPDVIVLAVRWYLRYGLSYRDVVELLAERGVAVDHVTVYRWVQRFTPLLIDAARPSRHCPGDRWFVDETYVKVNGRWRYVYRAVDQHGQVIDVLVSDRRDTAAARRFFTACLSAAQSPREVTTDRAPTLARAIDELIPGTLHDTEQYANNHIECDHGRLKARLRPMRGIKTKRTANTLIRGHAFIQNLRRGHYELGNETTTRLKIQAAFEELATAI